jgi:hypothetical protein
MCDISIYIILKVNKKERKNVIGDQRTDLEEKKSKNWKIL